VLVNDDDWTYCKTRFDSGSLETLKGHLGNITDPLARALCWSALWNMTRDALLPARDFVGLVLRFAGRESDIGVLQMLHAWANSSLVNYVAPEWRPTGERLLAEGALKELRLAEPGSQHQLAWARFFAAAASSPADLQLLQGLLEGTAKIDGLEVDQELRWAFLEPLASHGVADEGVLAAELARDDTASGKRHQIRCLAARPSAAVKAQAWAQVVESDALSNALVGATISGWNQSSQRELLAPYAEKYFGAIERVWTDRSIQIGMDVVGGLYPSLQQSQATVEATDAWLTAHEEAAPALRRLVLEARDDLARALRGQACDATAG
jgi:aminopeptidase N